MEKISSGLMKPSFAGEWGLVFGNCRTAGCTNNFGFFRDLLRGLFLVPALVPIASGEIGMQEGAGAVPTQDHRECVYSLQDSASSPPRDRRRTRSRSRTPEYRRERGGNRRGGGAWSQNRNRDNPDPSRWPRFVV